MANEIAADEGAAEPLNSKENEKSQSEPETRSSKRKRNEPEAAESPPTKKVPSIYDSQISDLKSEESSIKDGSHLDFVEVCRNLEKERDRKLKDAELVRGLRMKEVEALFSFEKKSANESFEVAKAAASEKMLGEIAESIKKLEDLRDGINDEEDASATRAKTRSLRSKTKKEDSDSQYTSLVQTSSSDRKKNKNTGIGLDFFMKEDTIENDLQAIHENWKQTAEKFGKKVEKISLSYSDGKLEYNGKTFSKDDEVFVQLSLTNEELLGTITGVVKEELQLKLADGSKARVLYSHLESGRCSLQKQSSK
mmetsp:Transcript_1886/g.2161  ORF Transcript_1886/g.2161 Transcript_1886/m.2161 type:complete len:309 (-) Transcript_1886:226-1152(-)